MKLVVGLGNPGAKYANTRHNAGFMAIEAFVSKLEGAAFKEESKFQAELCRHKIGGEEILFVKPLTFMNESGQPVGKIARFYKIPPESVAVVYDELDLPFGTVRTRSGGSSAGHNGVSSVIEAIGPDFWRIRIGIQNEQRATWDTSDFVLAPFNDQERAQLGTVIETAGAFIGTFVRDGQLDVQTSKL